MSSHRLTRRTFVNRAVAAMGASVLWSPLSASRGRSGQAVLAPVRGSISDVPYNIGHMTFLTGPAAVLAAPMHNGHLLAAEEINASGGLLGRRKITTIAADESAGTLANVNELKRMKRERRIDAFTGGAASDTTSALGPVAEELRLLTLFVDGSTDLLFERYVPRPKYVFRVNNLQSADGAACAVAVAKTWPEVRRVVFVSPDHWYGRSVFEHFHVAIVKLLPGASGLAEFRMPTEAADFAATARRLDALKPDLVVSALWGPDYGAFYRRALGAGLLRRVRLATTLAFGAAPHTIGEDHPEGVMAGVRSSYYWNLPAGRESVNDRFVRQYYNRWKEYPNYAAEGAYTALHLLRRAIERANELTGGWPDDEAIIKQLEGLTWESPAGRIVIRPENHQAYRDVVIGFSHHDARYPFTVLDPQRVIKIPIRSITAPSGWPAGPPSATYRWIERTWPTTR